MKLRDEFREPEVITKAAEEIRRRADPIRHYRIMKVCGGHTRAICNSGLKDVLPATRLLPRTADSAWRLPWQYCGFNTMEAMT
jgi:hydrogenase expression/formation protein HypD